MNATSETVTYKIGYESQIEQHSDGAHQRHGPRVHLGLCHVGEDKEQVDSQH